jgi:hypothetical protein
MTRPETRYSVDFPVFLTWQDRLGAVRRLPARCSNLSASGAHVETTDPFAPYTQVLVSSENFGRLGHASIRYCRRQGMRYRIGLQFTSALVLSDAMRKKMLAQAIGETVK